MRLTEVLAGIKISVQDRDVMLLKVDDITADTRRIGNGSGRKIVFFAYAGASFDSHEEARLLYLAGKVSAVISERVIDDVPPIIVQDGRVAFAKACANFFQHPDRAIKLIAVTGTNGKTTTTWILGKIFETAGIAYVRIGTTGAYVAGVEHSIDNTTPSPYDFHKYLAEGVSRGAKFAVVEVSSHALEQDRLAGVMFDVSIFTNLTGDHLDYHKDMEHYYQAKKLLFTHKTKSLAVINTDNEYGKTLYNETNIQRVSYGITGGNVTMGDYHIDVRGISGVIKAFDNSYEFSTALIGRFNLENILGAVAVALSVGIASDIIIRALGEIQTIPGRLERHSEAGVTIFVDYAHTDDALLNVLTALRELGGRRLMLVFGAGGNRDKSKRPRMGKVAEENADVVIITNDNPRTENPSTIIDEIMAGMTHREKVIIEPDRELAIFKVLGMAADGDIVLIAGKGHEDYQIIGVEKHLFDDNEIVEKVLSIKRRAII